MSMHILEPKREEISNWIETCKSKSMTTGAVLRDAHYKLGKEIAPAIADVPESKEVTVLVLMRAGLFFACGITDELEKLGYTPSLLLINGDVLSEEELQSVAQKDVIIVDAVINTGKSIFKLTEQLKNVCSITIATTVIPVKSLTLFDEYNLFTVRASENQYKGAKTTKIASGKGPDTGDRLFNTLN